MARVLVIQGHPDPAGGRFCHALADAYASGAHNAGHEVRRLEIAALDLPLLRTQADFETGEPPPAAREAQAAIAWAEHVTLVFPLWLGGAPALVHAFLEQTLRPNFAFRYEKAGAVALLKGRSARLIVTMGMPAFVYRFWFLAHGVRGLVRGVFGLVGVAPVRTTYIGMMGSIDEKTRWSWLARLHALGAKAR